MFKRILLIFIISISAFSKSYEVHGIDVKDTHQMFFEPSFLHINSGDDVTFIPSGFGHQPQSIFIPKEGKHWQSENGKKITVKFDKEGIYIFDCKYHYVMGMVGVIQVGRANNYKEAINFLKDYKKKVTMRKERLDSIFKKVKH